MLQMIYEFFRGRYQSKVSAMGEETPAVLAGGGTNTSPITTELPGVNFLDFRTKSIDATGADSRGVYLQHYLFSTASGETGRFFTTVNGAGAVGVHGVHCSLSFGASGTLTGHGAAIRGTLHVPNASLGGTAAAMYGELYADGASSAIGGNASFFRAVLGGNATGLASIEDSASLIRIEGGSNASGNVVGAVGNEPTWANKTHLIRCNLNGTVIYLVGVQL